MNERGVIFTLQGEVARLEDDLNKVVELLRAHYFRPRQNHPNEGETLDAVCDVLRKRGLVPWTEEQANEHMEEVLGL